MNTNRRNPHKIGAIACAIASLAFTAAGAPAAIPSTTDYTYATQPMLSGTVTWVNEHQIAVRTDQGEVLVLSLDTHTMVPVDLAPGMAMRIEFRVMDDGHRYARRIIPIRDGMSANRELVYSREAAAANEAAYATSTDGQKAVDDPGTASTARSATNQPFGTPLAATPSTDAYRVAMEPKLAGQVVSVNDHRIVVDTDQGQRVAVEMDSRTLVPTDLATGMMVRVDYQALENGPRYATRIVPIEHAAIASRELAYTRAPESGEVMAQYAAAEMPAATTEEASPSTEPAEEPQSMPRTASRQPLIALLGLLALGGAGALAFERGRVRSAR